MRIAVLGLGAMGSQIAHRLADRGFDVVGWNRSRVDVAGVRFIESVSEAFQADVVLSMLSNDEAVREVVIASGALTAANKHLVHLGGSTISTAFARELTDFHAKAGVEYLSTAVLGSPAVAAQVQLNVLAGGPVDIIDRVRPVLEAIGKHIWETGEQPVTANAIKIASNMMVMIAMEAMGEAVVLTEANGVPRERLFEVILHTMFGAPAYALYSEDIAARRFVPGLKAVLALKDLRLAREAASEVGRTLPVLEAVHRCMADVVADGSGDESWSVIAEHVIDAKQGQTAPPAWAA